MDTDDDVSTLEEEEEEVSLLCQDEEAKKLSLLSREKEEEVSLLCRDKEVKKKVSLLSLEKEDEVSLLCRKDEEKVSLPYREKEEEVSLLHRERKGNISLLHREDDQQEVSLVCHSKPNCDPALSRRCHSPAPSCPSPCCCNSQQSSHLPAHSSTSSLDDLLSSDNEDTDASTVASTTPSYTVNGRERKTVVRYVVQSARTRVTKDEKFVVYTVEAQRFVQYSKADATLSYEPSTPQRCATYKPSTPQRCATIERRYSQFLAVYTALLSSHRSLMEEFDGFPKKVIIGNFSKEVISERCKGLARFMNFVQDQGILSRTAVFSKFLYDPEVMTSNNLLLHSQFEEACPVLENTYILLNSLRWDAGLTLRTLCQLIVSLHAVGNYRKSFALARVALQKFESPSTKKIGRELYLPLLVFCDGLWRRLGKDRTYIKNKIELMHKHRRQDEVVSNLLDVVRDEIALRTLH